MDSLTGIMYRYIGALATFDYILSLNYKKADKITYCESFLDLFQRGALFLDGSLSLRAHPLIYSKISIQVLTISL